MKFINNILFCKIQFVLSIQEQDQHSTRETADVLTLISNSFLSSELSGALQLYKQYKKNTNLQTKIKTAMEAESGSGGLNRKQKGGGFRKISNGNDGQLDLQKIGTNEDKAKSEGSDEEKSSEESSSQKAANAAKNGIDIRKVETTNAGDKDKAKDDGKGKNANKDANDGSKSKKADEDINKKRIGGMDGFRKDIIQPIANSYDMESNPHSKDSNEAKDAKGGIGKVGYESPAKNGRQYGYMSAEPLITKDFLHDRDSNDRMIKYKYGPINQKDINLNQLKLKHEELYKRLKQKKNSDDTNSNKSNKSNIKSFSNELKEDEDDNDEKDSNLDQKDKDKDNEKGNDKEDVDDGSLRFKETSDENKSIQNVLKEMGIADPHHVVQPPNNDFTLKTNISRDVLDKAAADQDSPLNSSKLTKYSDSEPRLYKKNNDQTDTNQNTVKIKQGPLNQNKINNNYLKIKQLDMQARNKNKKLVKNNPHKKFRFKEKNIIESLDNSFRKINDKGLKSKINHFKQFKRSDSQLSDALNDISKFILTELDKRSSVYEKSKYIQSNNKETSKSNLTSLQANTINAPANNNAVAQTNNNAAAPANNNAAAPANNNAAAPANNNAAYNNPPAAKDEEKDIIKSCCLSEEKLNITPKDPVNQKKLKNDRINRCPCPKKKKEDKPKTKKTSRPNLPQNPNERMFKYEKQALSDHLKLDKKKISEEEVLDLLAQQKAALPLNQNQEEPQRQNYQVNSAAPYKTQPHVDQEKQFIFRFCAPGDYYDFANLSLQEYDMKIQVIIKQNRPLCLMRNNETIDKKDAEAEELKKLMTETSPDDEDTQTKIDDLLKEIDTADPWAKWTQKRKCTDVTDENPEKDGVLRWRMVVSQSNLDKSDFRCDLQSEDDFVMNNWSQTNVYINNKVQVDIECTEEVKKRNQCKK